MPSPSLDEFDQLAKKGPSRCKFGRLADSLPEEDRAALDAAAEGPYEHMVFVKWFAARGLKLSDKGVRAHRSGECCCVRVR